MATAATADLMRMWSTPPLDAGPRRLDAASVRNAKIRANFFATVQVVAAYQAAPTSSQPTTASSTQWLPVPTTTSAVTAAWAQPNARAARFGVALRIASATHSAHPACRDGNAASWLVNPPRPRGADASAPHQPSAELQAEHVDVPAGQPGRRHRQQQVEHQPGHGGDQQGAPRRGVRRRPAPVEPDQHRGGDDVVGGGVPVAADQAQPAHVDEEPVERVLPVQLRGRCSTSTSACALPTAGARASSANSRVPL